MPSLVHVAVAIIINQHNQVLISLRKKGAHQGGLWEFPGGKVEQDESVLDALKREIHEELDILIRSACLFKKIHHQYTDRAVLLEIWKVDSYGGEPKGVEGQQVKWQAIDKLNIEKFPAANRGIIQALKLPDKYMITGEFKNHKDFELKLENSLKNGISLVQLRCKNTPDDEYKQLIEIARILCEKYSASLLLNTSAEIFLNSNADGLHLNSQMLNSIESRPVRRESLLSVSCHSKSEIEKAKQLTADIILLSPVKETRSHPGVQGIGWQEFTELAINIDVPVYALGGMTADDLYDAKKSGAQGVAAISSFWDV